MRNFDTWQLLINTPITILTFLLVAVLQNSQRRSELGLPRVPFSELVTGVFTPESVRGDVWVVDITDPRSPRVVSDWAAGRDAGLAFGASFVRQVFGLGPPFDCTPPPGGEPLCRGQDFPAVFGHSVSPDATGTRAYVSHWDAGMVILDISDPARPRLLGRGAPGLEEEGDTHSAIPAGGNRLAVTTDEDQFPGPWGFTRIWDVVDPTRPVEVGRFATANALSARSDGDYSVHKPVVRGNRLYLPTTATGCGSWTSPVPHRPASWRRSCLRWPRRGSTVWTSATAWSSSPRAGQGCSSYAMARHLRASADDDPGGGNEPLADGRGDGGRILAMVSSAELADLIVRERAQPPGGEPGGWARRLARGHSSGSRAGSR